MHFKNSIAFDPHDYSELLWATLIRHSPLAMFSISAVQTDIPEGSLLARYNNTAAAAAGNTENYCDCYSTTIMRTVSLEEFVYAFYTSPAFYIERKLLAFALRVPSTDADARKLSTGESNRFSAWTVENRQEHEVLLRFPTSHTGSWFMARQNPTMDSDSTELYFGSVVFPKNLNAEFGLIFHALTGFHRYYSAALLNSAGKRVVALRNNGQ